MFSKPRGTRDILPDEMKTRRAAENVIRASFEKFGYQEIQTPLFENLELITAKSGEEIREHLYAFQDKSGRWLALRPELSAPTIRLYVNELRSKPKPQKLYYIENCFRYERPQKGRYREFWQAGIELIGTSKPEAEAEVVALAVKCLENVGLKNYGLSIGNRGIFRAVFNHYMVSEDVQNNIFNLLDKRALGGEDGLQRYFNTVTIHQEARSFVWALVKVIDEGNGVRLSEFENALSDKTKEIIKSELDNFKGFLEFLERFGVKEYRIDFITTRGLDYYTGMVFEIFAGGLGAQNQICGGGTYSLVKLFGGGDVPSCGFGFGFDRLMLALEAQDIKPKSALMPQLFIIPSSEKELNKAIKIATLLRDDIACDLELMGRKLDKSLSYADSLGIPYVVIVKDDSMILRNMGTGEQRTADEQEIKDAVT